MARRFCYVSLGILTLTATYQLGAGRASADWDLSVSGQIVGLTGHDVVWARDGTAWVMQPPGSTVLWNPVPRLDLPMSIGEVKFIGGTQSEVGLVTVDDVGWLTYGNAWVSIGSFPGPVPVEGSTWGQVKSRFGK